MKNKILVEKPWGYFEQFTLNEQTTVKILSVDAGHRLSYQVHTQREEYWRVIEGAGYYLLNSLEPQDFNLGDSLLIKPGDKHGLGTTDIGIKVLEISLGHFDEMDIVRLNDFYGRYESSPTKK